MPQIDRAVGCIQANAGNTRFGQRLQFPCIGNPVLIEIAPDLGSCELSIAAVENPILVAIQVS